MSAKHVRSWQYRKIVPHRKPLWDRAQESVTRIATVVMASAYKAISKTSSKSKRTISDPTSTAPKNKQRVLILSSRGITHRHRHLLNDLYALLPHSRKESKIDTKTKLYQLNELAELYNCNNILFFEARKGKDLYIWMSKPPNGPTVKLYLQNRTFPPATLLCTNFR